jgi:hypothetical protein
MSGNWKRLSYAVRIHLEEAKREFDSIADPYVSTKDRRQLIATARMLGFTFQQIADLTEYANKGTIYDILNGRFDR